MQQRSIKKKILYASAVIVVVALLSLLSQLENWQRDLTTNYAQLRPDAVDQRLRPPLISASPSEVAERITTWVAATPNWKVVTANVSLTEPQLHLTRTTRIFRWVDDIHVTLQAENGATRLQAESQSRVGKADFGQNPRNLRELLAGIDAWNGTP